MIINRDGIWSWYMMFEINIFYYGIWCSHMMFTCDTQIPTFHFRIWCSHVICTIIVYDVGIWCLYMMFTCDFICEDFRFCIWSFAYDVHMWCHMWRFLIWYMKLVYDNHPWSSSLIIWPTVCDHIRTFFENFHFPKIPYMMFTCEHFRIWCSHVNTFSHEMNFPLGSPPWPCVSKNAPPFLLLCLCFASPTFRCVRLHNTHTHPFDPFVWLCTLFTSTHTVMSVLAFACVFALLLAALCVPVWLRLSLIVCLCLVKCSFRCMWLSNVLEYVFVYVFRVYVYVCILAKLHVFW